MKSFTPPPQRAPPPHTHTVTVLLFNKRSTAFPSRRSRLLQRLSDESQEPRLDSSESVCVADLEGAPWSRENDSCTKLLISVSTHKCTNPPPLPSVFMHSPMHRLASATERGTKEWHRSEQHLVTDCFLHTNTKLSAFKDHQSNEEEKPDR